MHGANCAWLEFAVRIDEDDGSAFCNGESTVTSGPETEVDIALDDGDTRKTFPDERGGPIGGCVVNHDYFKSQNVARLVDHGGEAPLQPVAGVVTDDDDSDVDR